MSEKRNVIIFDKSEVFLIFLFIVLIALTTFTFGFRVGQSITYKKDGFTESDKSKIEEIKSLQEEDVEDIMKKSEGKAALSTEESDKKYYQGLQSELNKLREQIKNEAKEIVPESNSNISGLESKAPTDTIATNPNVSNKTSAAAKNKFTIQLGSHKTLKEAEEFADGFAVRGYDPIVSEVKIDGKGVWYRVSIGSFESMLEAKEYLKKEETLFQGQDYIVTELK